MSISTVLLAKNEAKNLEKMLPVLKEILDSIGEKYEILVIDSKSKDNTKSICEKNKVTYILNECEKLSYAGAYKTAIKYAKYEKFQILDCDFSHDPFVIEGLNKKFNEGYDVVIGSRYTKGGKTDDYLMSKIMSRTLNLVYRVLLGIKPKDISTSFRMYDTKQLKKITIESSHFEIQEEIIFKLMQNNKEIKIAEIPIYFNKRLYGESKREMIPFIKAYIKSLKTLILIKIRNKGNKK